MILKENPEERLRRLYPKYEELREVLDMDEACDFIRKHSREFDETFEKLLKEFGINKNFLNRNSEGELRYQAFQETCYKYGLDISQPYSDVATYEEFMRVLEKCVYKIKF